MQSFKESVLAFNHWEGLLKSWFTLFTKVYDNDEMISSGIFYAIVKVINVNKKKKKTKTEPWGTPFKIFWIVELWLLTSTNCFLFFS